MAMRWRSWRRSLAVLLAAGMLVSMVQPGAAKAAQPAGLADGVYEVDYNYYSYGKNSVSVSNNYLKEPRQKGRLSVSGGTATFEHEVSARNYGYFPYLGTRLPGKPAASIGLDPVTQKDRVEGMEGYAPVQAGASGGGTSYTLRYPIEQVDQPLDILMHVNMPEFAYDHWYNVQLKLALPETGPVDPGPGDGGGTVVRVTYEQVKELISVAESVYAGAVEGPNYGMYAPGSKEPLAAAIGSARAMLGLTADGDEAAYAQIHASLKASLAFFQSKRLEADKRELKNVLQAIESFLRTAKRHGDAEGNPGGVSVAIHPGEYYASNLDFLDDAAAAARAAIADPASAPAQIRQRIEQLESAYEAALANQYIQSRGFTLYALDTLEPTDKLSIYGNELDDAATSVVLRSSAHPLADFSVNIRLNVVPDNGVRQSIANPYPPYEPITFFLPQAGLNSAESAAGRPVYQVNPAGFVQADEEWLGLSMIQYEIGGETRTLYISYNADKLEELKGARERATQLLAAASEPQGAAAQALQEALRATDAAASNYAARRPELRAAIAGLEAAIAEFREQAAYRWNYTAADGAADRFSPRDGDLLKPALLSTAGGVRQAVLTLQGQAAAQTFEVLAEGEYRQAETVSADEAAGTRTIRFPIAGDGLTAARLKSAPSGADAAAVHELRLNFNGVDNRALSTEAAAAAELLAGAAVGSAQGQYPASAKAALQSALAEAEREAAAPAGSQAASELALAALKKAVQTFRSSVVKDGEALADGTYPLDFRIYKKGTDENSVMADYVDLSSGKLEVSGGSMFVSFRLKQSREIVSFKTMRQGSLQETERLEEDAEANTRIVRFQAETLKERLPGWVKIYWKVTDDFLYDHEYEVDLSFALRSAPPQTSALESLLRQADALLKDAVEGTAAGQYEAGAKASLAEVAEAARQALGSAAPDGVAEASRQLEQAIVRFKGSVRLGSAAVYRIHLSEAIRDETGSRALADLFDPDGSFLYAGDARDTAVLSFRSGVGVVRLQKEKADGSLELILGKAAAPAPAAAALRTAEELPSRASFELDRKSYYRLTLAEGGKELVFRLELATASYAAVPGGGGGGGAGAGAEEVYSIDFTFNKAGTQSPSVMQDYVVTPGRLTVRGGVMAFSFQLKQSKEIPGFKIDTGSGLMEPAVVSTDAAANTRTVQFAVPSLDQTYRGWVDVKWPEMDYFHSYDVDLKLKPESKKLISIGGASMSAPEAKLADLHAAGRYDIGYKLKSPSGQQIEHLYDYFQRPAKLVVADGRSFVELQASYRNIPKLSVKKDDKWIEAEQPAADEKANKRVFRIEVERAGDKLAIRPSFFVPNMFDTSYELELLLDAASVKAEAQPAPSPSPTPSPVPAPSATPAAVRFGDVQGHWAEEQIALAVARGWAKGYENGVFKPNAAVTRAELAVLLHQALGQSGEGAAPTFTDAAAIPAWAAASVAAGAQAKLLIGYEDGSFRPGRAVSRAEAAVIAERALGTGAAASAGESAAPEYADAAAIPAWARAAAAQMQRQGIMKGRPESRFAPADKLTRAEAVTLLLALHDRLQPREK